MDTDPISEFFDHEACCRPVPEGVAGVSGDLLEALDRTGLEGLSVLEVGCGTGALAMELVGRGAATVTGLDLSPRSIEAARARAAASALGARATFAVGDAATGSLAQHDVVVSSKVICCYPDPETLIANSLPAAGSVYAFALPESRGLRGLAARAAIGAENAWRRLRGDPFRAFVHRVDRIEAQVRAGGFHRVGLSRRRLWRVAVYARPRVE
jgi:magnesium-protoporphyrin O-methyltransferase